MPTPTYPGVYVEEVASGVRPIPAASTSTAAFVGQAERGSLTEAKKVFNFTEYQNAYGGFLDTAFLSHAVYQFFNNGGSQCYVVRVAGANTATASVAINDRGAAAQRSLTVRAQSPGAWGNRLAVVIADGTRDATNEFDLSVFWQDELTPLETFRNLGMTPGAPNFVDTVLAASRFVRVTANPANTNAAAGTSRGASAPASLTGTGRSRLRVNVDNDGYQEVDLTAAIGGGAGQVADLTTAANQAAAIRFVVRALVKRRASTNQAAFSSFACVVDAGVLLLTSGAAGLASSVSIAAAGSAAQDATGLLRLGRSNGGVERLGASVTRPLANPAVAPPANYYLVGDHAVGGAVAAVVAGSDGDPILNDQPYVDAFQRLNDKDDVSLLAVPGIGSAALVGAGMNYCATRPLSDVFFLGDMSQDDDTVEEALAFDTAVSPKNSYGAVYLPWVRMLDPLGRSAEPILAPPSGFMAGLYARTDAQRGVWKAPAGVAAGLGGAVGLAVNFTDVQQGNLNPRNVDVIRQFASSGIVAWGARTVSGADPEYNYVPVRRTAIMLRVSIYRGIQWAVFEPNDSELWAQLRLNIGAFMSTLYRRGAFQGDTPAQAFFVKCDGETTTQDDINLGIVNVLVGFAPLRPAEFVVVRISQKAGQTA